MHFVGDNSLRFFDTPVLQFFVVEMKMFVSVLNQDGSLMENYKDKLYYVGMTLCKRTEHPTAIKLQMGHEVHPCTLFLNKEKERYV